jgi:hypothetical protein
MTTTLIIQILAGMAGSLILGIIIGSVWATKRAFRQMLFQQAHNDMIRQFTESLKWKGENDESSSR